MLQVIQPIDGGATDVAEVPDPVCGPGQVLIANRASLVSAGTERSTIELARQSLLQKARQRPDQVRRVLEKVKTEGLVNTISQVRTRLEQPIPLGYSSAGVVLAVGSGVREFHVGDRVASNGPHAGVAAVGKNLVARIPDEVPFEHAAYAVVGSIALQGVRLARVGLGDVAVVVGLGLIGQIATALLRAAGCRVIGADVDPAKIDLALAMGADGAATVDRVEALAAQATGGRGADAVLIAASTSSSDPLELAARLARERARVVAVGAVGLNVPRRDFYFKELELVVSKSYGPGRYDPAYEEQGVDYPYPHVRWTEQRNIQAVLEQMAAGRLPVERLTTHRFPIADAPSAYRMIESASESYLGVLLTYPETPAVRRVAVAPSARSASSAPPARLGRRSEPASRPVGVSFVGAGGFAASTLAPAFARASGATLRGAASARGLSARTLARKHRFAFAAADLDEILADPETRAVVVATRHCQHTPMGLAALRAGKHLFLEKPLAISFEQLDEWRECLDGLGDDAPVWTVGYNRRFSPAARLVRRELERIDAPMAVTIRFNAGPIPPDHWVHDPDVGGGRIVGEACHAVDLAMYLIGSPPVRVWAEAVSPPGAGPNLEDNAVLTFKHADGSVSTVLYTSGGDRSAGKERVEVHAGGLTAAIDDFRRVQIRRSGCTLLQKRWWSQQKGYREEVEAFLTGVREGRTPIPAAELLVSAAATLRAVQSLRLETPLEIEAG